MRNRLIAAAIVTTASVASAQPGVAVVDPPSAEPVAPVPEPVPVVQPPPTPIPVLALDGEAANYEQAPGEHRGVAGSLVRGVRVGGSYVVQGLLSPFRGLVYVESRWHTFSKIRTLFVNDAGTAGIVPTASFQSGFGLNVGAKAFIDNAFGAHEEVGLSASTGGSVVKAFQLKAELPKLGGAPIYVKTRVRYEENDNLFFAGIGNAGVNTGEMLAANASSVKTRFSQERLLTVLSTGLQFGGQGNRLRIGGSGIYNDRSFGAAGSTASDPSIETVYDTSTLRGFDDGYRTLELTGDLEWDTRDHRGATTNGAVIRGFAGGTSLIDSPRYQHYGAEASYYLSPFWPGRVFVGRVALEGIRHRNNDVPFTELPRLGGAGLLRGYNTDQFRDNLATVATLEYHWPVHENLSGEVFVETGKVAPTYDQLVGDGFRQNWHVGYGGGLILHTQNKVRIRFDIAYGDGIAFYAATDVLDAFRKREREL